jgi:multiple antibiotic resistance protein
MSELFESSVLLLMLLNPFFVILYLIDVMQKKSAMQFAKILINAGLISSSVFVLFGLLGDYIFRTIFQADFASFQIFGGIVFLLIGIQFVLKGTHSIDILRGDSNEIAGAIALPIMIGPGTISASVLTGKKLDMLLAVLSILFAVGVSIFVMILLKYIHDYVRPKREILIERYTEIAGRLMALYVGTFSVDMIMKGIKTWLGK